MRRKPHPAQVEMLDVDRVPMPPSDGAVASTSHERPRYCLEILETVIVSPFMSPVICTI